VGDEDPWLLDMATSAITYNRVQRQKSLGRSLPPGVASTEDGTEATDPNVATMLAPLGGDYGFKGAGLAGLVEILSVILAGMRLDRDLLPMSGPDFETPRGLGGFVLALDPSFFSNPDAFAAAMRQYREALRASAARPGGTVLAPGDREWTEGRRRREAGIPLDPETVEAFGRLAARYALGAPI
jgi:LDH2 family malate/lactate/ureidoglycolate dehydrogenase